MSYTECHLNSSGRVSQVFMGRLIASVNNRDTSKETRNTWDQVVVYEIDPEWAKKQSRENGTIILPYSVGIARPTRWKGGRNRFKVIDCNTLEQVVDVIRVRVPHFHREIEEQIRLDSPTMETRDYEPGRSPMVP